MNPTFSTGTRHPGVGTQQVPEFDSSNNAIDNRLETNFFVGSPSQKSMLIIDYGGNVKFGSVGVILMNEESVGNVLINGYLEAMSGIQPEVQDVAGEPVGTCDQLKDLNTEYETIESQTYTLDCGGLTGRYIKWQATNNILTIVETWANVQFISIRESRFS